MIQDPEVDRGLNDLLRGKTYAASAFNLAVAPATSTVVTKTGVSSNSVILTQAYSTNASNADITRIVPAKDSFTVYHSSSANTRTHRYIYLTGVAT